MRLLQLSKIGLIAITCLCFIAPRSTAQDSSGSSAQAESSDPEEMEIPEVPAEVSVEAVAADQDIKARLERILEATDWFEKASVVVDDGVVFLTGTADKAEHSKWAAELAGNTQDVVAVVNRMNVTEPPLWDISPAVNLTRDLARSTIQSLPLIAIAAVILVLTWLATIVTLKIADATFLKRVQSNLLREVVRKATAVPVIVLGLYLVLLVSGLSRLAVTVIGGTGLFGLVLGVAFRDIMENFLASILISIQHPFKYGDLIEVDGHEGYVQRVNTRGTLLMTCEGNHVQIPNSTIYKNVIQNFTSNPNQRFDFVVGVGYDASVTKAQEISMEVLREHPAVLDDPEPWVVVEQLGSATVNLRCYFWVNGKQHSGVKVKSSVIRQVMRRLEAAEISMPDDAREIVFPSAVPVQMLPERSVGDSKGEANTENNLHHADRSSDESVSNHAEGDFASEAEEIHEQASASRDPDEAGADLLRHPDGEDRVAKKDTELATSAS